MALAVFQPSRRLWVPFVYIPVFTRTDAWATAIKVKSNVTHVIRWNYCTRGCAQEERAWERGYTNAVIT